MTPTPLPENAHLRALALELAEALRRAKRAVDDEIRAYPTPIPRCDAQFNHLYEQRARLAEVLASLDAAANAKDGGALRSALSKLVAAPMLPEDAEELRLRARAQAALSATLRP